MHPLPVAQQLHLTQAGTSTHALGCHLAGSSRSWVAHDGGGSGSRTDPSTDRVLTDWVLSHHVWAGLIDTVR